jgi:hypothetical protein
VTLVVARLQRPHTCAPCVGNRNPNPGVLLCAYCDLWFCYTHLADPHAHECAKTQLMTPKFFLKG